MLFADQFKLAMISHEPVLAVRSQTRVWRSSNTSPLMKRGRAVGSLTTFMWADSDVRISDDPGGRYCAGQSPHNAGEYLLVTIELRTWPGDFFHISASIEVKLITGLTLDRMFVYHILPKLFKLS